MAVARGPHRLCDSARQIVWIARFSEAFVLRLERDCQRDALGELARLTQAGVERLMAIPQSGRGFCQRISRGGEHRVRDSRGPACYDTQPQAREYQGIIALTNMNGPAVVTYRREGAAGRD